MSARVAIVGAGAIGSYVGAHMTKAGEDDVVLIDPFPEHVEYIRTKGVHLSGMLPRDNFSVRVNAMHLSDVQQLAKQRPIDFALIAVKSYDTPWATELIKPYLAPAGFCVSLQNCMNEEEMAKVIGWGKTLGIAITGMGVELFAPGHVKRNQVAREGHVVFRVGEVHGRVTRRAEEVARAIAPADSSKVTDNLWGERWSKLIGNGMRNGLAAVSDMGGPEQDGNEITRWIMMRLGSEGVRVGQALGFKLVATQGMDSELLARAGEGDRTAIDEIARHMVEGSKRRAEDNRPSMAQDVAKGRRTEIDQMNGLVVAKGREVGVPAPVNAKIRDLVGKVERGELKPGLDAVRGV